MKAMVIREFGSPEVMKLEEIPTPQPGPDEVLIRVHAVSVNRTLDLAVRAGTYAFVPALPHVLGVDPSGVVAGVGPRVEEACVDHIKGFAYSAPYEDLKLKPSR